MLTSLELFAGGGGVAIASEKAGFTPLLINDIDKYACQTLRVNRPDWNIIHSPIQNLNFTGYSNVDLLTGGFPCQSFSHSGKREGLADNRGNLFYEFLRAIKESQPKVFIGENVKGLLTHNKGKTIEIIYEELKNLDNYIILDPLLLKAEYHNVPQKRHRVFIIGIRIDQNHHIFTPPKEKNEVATLEMALKAGGLYEKDTPYSNGAKYSETKRQVLELVPPGKNWNSLPKNIKEEYMGRSLYTQGGKTGMARRISWDEPCLTLTCSPTQKQTERCHPDETRPFTIREYARIQTFPDDWKFCGSISNQYKQIGNAVPVNLAYTIINSIKSVLKLN